MSAEASSRIVAHVGVGKTYGIVVGIIQGFVEALILLIHYHENIFQPQDIFQSHVFLFLGKILDFDRIDGIPFIIELYYFC